MFYIIIPALLTILLPFLTVTAVIPKLKNITHNIKSNNSIRFEN
jgi:hypothetical protein